MHNLKRRAIGSLMAVMVGTTTILGSAPVSTVGAYTYGDFICGTGAIEAEQEAKQVDTANNYGLVSATEGNILHAWDWKFTDVTKSLKDIAEAGYSLVQVSPCQVCEDTTTNNDWWKLYQPYDYKFGNSLGSADEFKEMCAKAKEYGISIIVDVVANHVAGTGTGACGERKPQVDSWWTDDKFHNTGVKFTGTYDNNREMMVRSNIGMPDIDTGRSDVQERMVSYLETMLDMGAGGFRYDAAKHIGTTSDSGNSKDTFWKTISDAVSAKKPDALVYGEILNGMPVTDKYYVNDGIKVTESQKGWDMKDAIQKGLAASVNTDKPTAKDVAFTYVREASADKLITWVENHDTYLNHWGSTGLSGHANYMSDAGIMLAWSTVGARADSQALYYARPDGCSNPKNPNDNDASNTIAGALGMSTKNFDWKDSKVASVNKFKNAMVGEGETLSANGDVAIIKRGTKGVVITNFGGSDGNFSVDGLTGLKDGTYKDASGQNGSYTVSGGKVSGSVKGKTFVVLYDANAATPATSAPVTSTPATETSAPVTEAPKGAAVINVTKGDGTFTKTYEEKITVESAKYAYYSNDGAEWTELKDGKATVKIGEGAKNNGDTYALYVKAMGEDGKLVDFKKTYTYTTGSTGTTPVTKGLKVRVKKSVFTNLTSAPYLYLYTATTPTVEAEGKWPGALMKEEGDYYVYTNESLTSEVLAIFNNNGTWQEPSGGEMAKGYAVTGYVEFDGTKMSEVKEDAPATASPDAKKANVAPEFKLSVTETPATQTPAPVSNIKVSKEDGTSFTSETMEVEISVGEGATGSYIVDNGPVKTFTGKATAVLGQGKIADSDVTLTVIAGTETKTFTYKKVFDKAVAAKEQASGMVVKGNAVMKIQNLFEVVADAAEVKAGTLAGEPASSYFATNPNGQTGSKKTIASAADFTEDMIIAQGVANDSVSIFKGSHEGPVYDSYAMFGAYDDKNVYIGIQYTNVIDVTDPAQGYPISDNGKPSNGDIPQMMVFDTRSGDYTDGTANDKTQKTAWDIKVKFAGDAKVDRVFTYSAKPEVNNTALFPVTNGLVDYTKVQSSKEGTDSGITYKYEDGFFCSKMNGINGNGYSGYRPEELNEEGSNWVDFLTTSHKTTQDTFMTMTIPMSALGVTVDKVASEGIGVMGISTFGESGIGSIPQDLTMFDTVMEGYVSKTGSDESTSMEKADEDIVTVALAQLGGTYSGPVKTKAPATKAPETETPATKVPETKTPATKTPEVTATPVVDDTTTMVVNFGADKSSPQLLGTTLELKAIGYNQTGASTYEFAVDGEVVQAASADDTYTWTPVAGQHTIQVTMKDEAGKIVVVKKAYMIGDGSTIIETKAPATEAPATEVPATEVPVQTEVPTTGVPATEVPTTEMPATETPVQSEIPTTSVPTANPGDVTPTAPATVVPTQIPEKMRVLLGFKKASPQKLGTSIGLVANVTGGKAGYKYTYVAELSNGFTQKIAKNTSKNTVTWKPTKTGTYTITVTVTDANGVKATDSAKYKVIAKTTSKKKLAITKATVSKKTVKVNKKIKITAKGTAKKGTLKFKFVVKKNGQKKVTTIKKYSTKKTAYWKPKKAGKYTITVYATDSSKKVVKKTIKVTVKKK